MNDVKLYLFGGVIFTVVFLCLIVITIASLAEYMVVKLFGFALNPNQLMIIEEAITPMCDWFENFSDDLWEKEED